MDYVDGQFGPCKPIAVEQTASGYQVAWKVEGADQYTIWTTDSNGNYLSDNGALTGSSATLELSETGFHQDLNGDGVIGPVMTTVESNGSTSLTEIGGNFYLLNSSGTGPTLKYGGVDYVDGQFGPCKPIAVEQTASGYQVAWKVEGADQYTIWTTDSNGNYLSDNGALTGSSATLELSETGFHQDLNGDGVIGPVMTTVESNGSTSLTEIGGNFYLLNSSGTGPTLKYGGVDYVDGQFGPCKPIAVEQTASGYQVAWKVEGADQYTIWTTDSNGNYLSDNGALTGSSATLELAETGFHQDLNGDGVIGPVMTTVESNGSTSLTEIGGNFYLLNSSGTGPTLKYGGVDYVDGQFGPCKPIAVEQTASGYQVAWKVEGADQYTIWTTDSNGNYLSDNGALTGSSATLELSETGFHQDLNGDGVIGPVMTTVESNGSTSLTEIGGNFYLLNGSGTGPTLKYGGVDYVDGQFGPCKPIAVEQTASGYQVAWKVEGADQYTIWTTDSNGNYLSDNGALTGSSATLELSETGFHQDLNGDGVIGPVMNHG